MDECDVPQEGNTTLGGHSKLLYARDASGRLHLVPSRGWEAEEIVTRQAVDEYERLARQALEQIRQGRASALLYHMYRARMDASLLSQSSGVWRWRVRRHLRAAAFGRAGPRVRQAYARALGVHVAQLAQVPLP